MQLRINKAYIGISIVSILFIIGIAIAATDDLDVTSCETTACTAANLNTNDTTSGVTVGKDVVTQPVMDNLPGDASTINSVRLHIRWTENTKTNGNNELQLQKDSTNAQYGTCSWTDGQGASGDEYHEWDASGCHSWTVADLNDLQVYYKNADIQGGGSVDLTFVDVYVDYEVSAGDTCDYTSGDFNIDCTENCIVDTEANVAGNNVEFSGSGTVQLNADITNYAVARIQNGCTVRQTSIGGLKG